MNSYYLKGYEQKDAKPFEPLQLVVEKAPKVKEYIDTNLHGPDKERLEKVSNFIQGFESPYGLELLATVDYLVNENQSFDLSKIKEGLEQWSERKQAMFTDVHIELAIKHLKEYPALSHLFCA